MSNFFNVLLFIIELYEFGRECGTLFVRKRTKVESQRFANKFAFDVFFLFFIIVDQQMHNGHIDAFYLISETDVIPLLMALMLTNLVVVSMDILCVGSAKTAARAS